MGRRGDIPLSVLQAALGVKRATASALLRQIKAEPATGDTTARPAQDQETTG